MPRHPKPKDQRQNSERVDVGDVPEGDEPSIEAPKPLRGWLAATKRSWARYWQSPGRHVTIESLDIDLLERLWSRYDELARAERELRKARVVIGSQGQERPSGFYTVISRLDAEIRQLEDRVAKSAKSRLVLGMTVGERDRGTADPDERADQHADAGDGADDVPPDPRIHYLDRKAG